MSVPPRGSCYGFGIRSDLDFLFLRNGNGSMLEIDVHDEQGPQESEDLLVEWKPRPGRPFHGRVYSHPESGRLRVWTSDAGWYLVDIASGRISVPAATEPVSREARLWTTPMLLTFVMQGKVPIHAAAVEVDRRALLFGGPSGFGKTSLAAAFAARGHRLLAEDVACISTDGEHPTILPGPSLLRLRPDVAEWLHIPGARVVATMPDRIFLSFEEDLRGDCQPIPLEGLVLLRGVEDKVNLKPLDGPEMLRDLWALAFRLPTDADTERAFDGVTVLANHTKIWDLHRPHDLTRLVDTVDEIVEALD